MKIGIIGGGASGMAAAIAAADCGADVTILEQNDRVGKKILATGNGKCNLSNLDMSEQYYHSDNPERILPILEQVTPEDTLAFFHGLGLMTKEKNGSCYPLCEQAAAVLDVLRFALERRGVSVETGCRVNGAEKKNGRFLVHIGRRESHRQEVFDRIILACGSRAGLKNDTEENGTALAGLFSLKRIPFTPALVQLRCRESCFRALAGVRCQAEVTLRAGGHAYREYGELQLTEYGISGIPVFQLSRHAAKELKRRKTLPVMIDFLPQISRAEWETALQDRIGKMAGAAAEQFFTGTVHKKIAGVVLKESGISPAAPVTGMADRRLFDAGMRLKCFPVTVTGTNPFAQAQVCAGGVALTEITDRMEAKRVSGLYVTGELLDADGRCGGYNLQWAWATCIIAGRAAAEGAGRRLRGNITGGKYDTNTAATDTDRAYP